MTPTARRLPSRRRAWQRLGARFLCPPTARRSTGWTFGSPDDFCLSTRRLRPPDPDQDGAVRGDRGAEGIGEGAELLLLPEIAHRQPAAQAQVGPPGGDGRPLQPAVEEADSRG